MSKKRLLTSSCDLKPQSKRRKVSNTPNIKAGADVSARIRLEMLGEHFMRQFEASDTEGDSDESAESDSVCDANISAGIKQSKPQAGSREDFNKRNGIEVDHSSSCDRDDTSSESDGSASEGDSSSESDSEEADVVNGDAIVGICRMSKRDAPITEQRRLQSDCETYKSVVSAPVKSDMAVRKTKKSIEDTIVKKPKHKIHTRTNAQKQPLVVDATCYGNMNNKYQETAMRKERQAFLSAKVSNVHQKIGREQKLLASGGRIDGNYLDWMEDVHKEVEKLGASTLTGKAKKQYEAKEIIRLGGNAPKNQKVPLIIKTGMNKKAKERAEKAETALKLLGMYVKKPKERAVRSDDSKGLDVHAGVGSFKAGVLKVNKDLFAKPTPKTKGPKIGGKGGAKGRKRK